MKPIVVQEWEERERGWGSRPDGFSLHLTNADCEDYCKQYFADEKKRNPSGIAPDEYSTTSGSPKLIDVDDSIYDALFKVRTKNSKGIRVYCKSLKDLKNERVFQTDGWLANDIAKQIDKLDSLRNIPKHSYIWKWHDAPEEFKNLTGLVNYNFVAYVPESLKSGGLPFKSHDHYVLNNGGELHFIGVK